MSQPSLAVWPTLTGFPLESLDPRIRDFLVVWESEGQPLTGVIRLDENRIRAYYGEGDNRRSLDLSFSIPLPR